MNGIGSLLGEDFTGTQASYTFGGQHMFGASAGGALPGAGGSQGGVPDNASVAGDPENAAQTQARASVAFGANTGKQPAYNQPVFWAFVSLALGVFLLAHLAHLNIRD